MKTVKTERDMRITHDCTGEFTVPDYLPAVEKLLSAECTLAPDGVYLKSAGASGLTAELGGEATFLALWQGGGDDMQEKKPSGAAFRCDYETAASLGSFSDGASPRVRAVTTVESVFCRVSGPRKLSFRARLSTKVTAMSETVPTPPDGCDAPEVETLTQRLTSAAAILGESRDLYASVPIPSASAPIYCKGAVRVDSAAPSSPSECRLTGEAVINCFYSADGEIRSEAVSLPFNEAVALELPSELSFDDAVGCRGFGSVTQLAVRESEGDYMLDVTYDLLCEALFSGELDAVCDAYSTKGASAVFTRELCCASPLACASSAVSVNEQTGASRTGKVELVTGNAALETCRAERGKLRLSGSLVGTALIKTDGERESVPYSVPWTCELPLTDASLSCELPDCIAETEVLSLSGRADGELSVSAELFVSATATAPARLTVVSALETKEESASAPLAIRVCYPRKGESAWELAKRCRVPLSRVACAENTDENGAPRRVVVV